MVLSMFYCFFIKAENNFYVFFLSCFVLWKASLIRDSLLGDSKVNEHKAKRTKKEQFKKES